MNTIITIDRVLVYYDLPQVFVGKDAVGSLYLCLLEESQEEYDEYLGISISQYRLFELLAGKIDLRSVYLHPEIKNYYVIRGYEEFDVVESKNFIDESDLPADDFFIHYDLDPDDIIYREVSALNKPVFHIGVVDEHSRPDVDVEVLGKVLISFKGMYSNAMPKLGVTGSRSLRAFVDQAASFNLHVYADVEPDLFGTSNVDKVFAHIDKMLSYSDTDEYGDCLRTVRAYSLNHYGEIRDVYVPHLTKWKWERLPLLTQSVLLMSYAHFYYVEKIDKKVVINVAVNLAKKYIDEQQAKFINAILDKVLK